MFLFKGGQMVEKGTYWEPNTREKIILDCDGFLPVNKEKVYYKIPDSYVLIPILLCGFALSVAFPYGIGVAIFGLLCVTHMALYSLSSKLQKLLGKLIANMLVEYRPQIAFFLGSERRRKRFKNKQKR